MKKEKLKNVDKKIEAIASLMTHWGWPVFTEVVQYLQGYYTNELFTKRFMELEPVQKDSRHREIVGILNALNRILELPSWLENRKPEKWDEFRKALIQEMKNG